LLLHVSEGGFAIEGRGGVVAELFQQPHGNLAIHGFVVGD
jgi:hypothetical protein